jgi:ankyrin repeat protein
MTALMQAVLEGREENVRLLLAAGANPTIKDRDGEAAVDLTGGVPRIKELLRTGSPGLD